VNQNKHFVQNPDQYKLTDYGRLIDLAKSPMQLRLISA